MKQTIITKQDYIKGNKYDVLKYQQQEKDGQYCYKPYRTIHNY